MIKLLDEFNKTDSAQEIFNEIRKLEKRLKLNVDIYKDKVDGEINLGWVLRFTISTNEIGLKNSKEVVKKLGTSFGNYIQRYKKEK